MIKKTAKRKTAAKKAATKKGPVKSTKETNPAEVRKEVSKMVAEEATVMAQAVIDEAKKGQMTTMKYLFEMANIYPAVEDGEQATQEEDCLAKMLLDKMSPPRKAATDGAEDELEAETEGAKPDAGNSNAEAPGRELVKEPAAEGVECGPGGAERGSG